MILKINTIKCEVSIVGKTKIEISASDFVPVSSLSILLVASKYSQISEDRTQGYQVTVEKELLHILIKTEYLLNFLHSNKLNQSF